MPSNHSHDVEKVEANHGQTFPQHELPVGKKSHRKPNRNDEEANVSDEGLLADLELAHQSHGTRDNGGDKAGRSYQFAHRHAATVRSHGGERAEDIR
jgi:hypothetical protein